MKSNEHWAKFNNPYTPKNLEIKIGWMHLLIQQSWQLVKDGQFEAFKAQQVIADPRGFWGLQLYDTLFALDPALQPMFTNTFTQSQMLTEMVGAALGLLPGILDQALGEEKTAIDPQLIPILVDLA